VMSVLDNARALAMKNNRPTIAMFVPRFINEKETRITAYIAEWTGGANSYQVDIPASPCFATGSSAMRVFERFRLVKNTTARQLPKGITVAGPNYKTCESFDNKWVVPPAPTKPTEAAGRAVAVLYLADGSTQTSLPQTATGPNNYPFIDFDNDGGQDRSYVGTNIDLYYLMLKDTDEPCAEFAPFIAVFDEDQARGFQGDSDWNDENIRINELSQYINANADRIHFNRYTGVAMK
jgi:hypothetical protein